MLKSIQLKFSKIKYKGDSIGDDIRIEIEALGKFLRVDKRIKVGKTAKIDKEVGRFETDQKSFQMGILINAIEKDLLFNDVANLEGNIKINTASTKLQQFVFKVKVRETRSIFGRFWGTKTAVFEITLEAEVSDAIRYVPDLDESQGFINVRLEDNKSIEELPAYLKVKLERADTKREYFTILEGPYRGKLTSIKLKENGSSWFVADIKHEPMIRAKYSISQKIFILKGKKYETRDYPKSPWKKGLYDIEIPDYSHDGGRRYLKESKRAMTWFKIGHGGEKYLHTGGRSLGCMTVVEVKRWMEIYNLLIKARKGDYMSVGVLEVVD
ncbi:hypothetical protein KKF64_02660 [Patescibacteria group bacterium]|nr:hypothetical protein [Patescibacteria group bacterium]